MHQVEVRCSQPTTVSPRPAEYGSKTAQMVEGQTFRSANMDDSCITVRVFPSTTNSYFYPTIFGSDYS
jgi:hypothetical protein